MKNYKVKYEALKVSLRQKVDSRPLVGVKLFLVLFLVMAAALINYDNPNKFLLQPRFIWDGSDHGFNEMWVARKMIFNRPFWPGNLTALQGQRVIHITTIKYIFPTPIIYRGQPLTLLLRDDTKIPMEQFLKNERPVESKEKPPYHFRDFADPGKVNHKINGLVLFRQFETKLNIATPIVEVDDRSNLQLDVGPPQTACHYDDQWTIEFARQENVSASLLVDGCHNVVKMFLSPQQYARLTSQEQSAQAYLSREFQRKFSHNYVGTSLCVLDWSQTVFYALINSNGGDDLVSSLTQVLKDPGTTVQNGISYTVLGYGRMHRHYLYILFGSLFILLLAAESVAVQIWVLGFGRYKYYLVQEYKAWAGVFKSLLSILWQSPAITYQKYVLWRREVAARKNVAKLNRETQRNAAELQRLRELQRKKQLVAEKAAKEDAEAKAREMRAGLMRDQLSVYLALDLSALINHPWVDKELAEKTRLAWEVLKRIPVGEDWYETQAHVDQLNEFSRWYGQVELAHSAYKRQLTAVKAKLNIINALDATTKSRFTSETHNNLALASEVLQSPVLKPRELRQVAHTVEKIVSLYGLSV